jgi:hypothetical protein
MEWGASVLVHTCSLKPGPSLHCKCVCGGEGFHDHTWTSWPAYPTFMVYPITHTPNPTLSKQLSLPPGAEQITTLSGGPRQQTHRVQKWVMATWGSPRVWVLCSGRGWCDVGGHVPLALWIPHAVNDRAHRWKRVDGILKVQSPGQRPILPGSQVTTV